MNIERRRRWIEEIHAEWISVTDLWWDAAENHRLPDDFDYLCERRKRLLSLLRRVRRCPECRGKGTTTGQGWTGRPWMEYQVLVEEECLTCGGTGRL